LYYTDTFETREILFQLPNGHFIEWSEVQTRVGRPPDLIGTNAVPASQ
jgi:hypothetical protein